VTVSVKVRRAVEEEVKRRELELIRRRLENVKDFLDLIDIDRVVKSVREDRESS
jgi:hypothetical protein